MKRIVKDDNTAKNGRILLSVILFCILIFVLVVLDIDNFTKNSIAVYTASQEERVLDMMYSATEISELNTQSYDTNLVEMIKSNFSTSSSIFCFVAKDDQIIFLKDDNTTLSLLDKYSGKLEDVIRPLDKEGFRIEGHSGSLRAKLYDHRDYYVSVASYTYDNVNYKLGICSREYYLTTKMKMQLLLLHVYTYLTLIIIAFISLTFFLLQKTKKDRLKINQLESETANSRLLIDKLNEDILKITINKTSNRTSGLLAKDLVESIIHNLSEEQKKQTFKVCIKIQAPRQELYTNVAAQLDRFYVDNCISCLWSENEFLVLLPNSSYRDAKYFIQVFHQQYVISFGDYQEDILMYVMLPEEKIGDRI
ncbi:hypothetical protein H0486_06310 [Lachnospiraceae bacterium MD1]|uniref:GGDEF domain-containing protein n=1 Tax=Variimorphobacter saccharofermentans TaxID=2755051 RepID=A0A839JXT9_9FIRM|nr:hypothetical protein [Variimorphobacter saccharofermentans]MBB2182483.1 hypothetical protein [Variimorphobacter saccharofermentans]